MRKRRSCLCLGTLVCDFLHISSRASRDDGREEFGGESTMLFFVFVCLEQLFFIA